MFQLLVARWHRPTWAVGSLPAGPPSRLGAILALAGPPTGNMEERGASVPPTLPPSVQPVLIYAAEMNSETTFCFFFPCKFSSSGFFFAVSVQHRRVGASLAVNSFICRFTCSNYSAGRQLCLRWYVIDRPSPLQLRVISLCKICMTSKSLKGYYKLIMTSGPRAVKNSPPSVSCLNL